MACLQNCAARRVVRPHHGSLRVVVGVAVDLLEQVHGWIAVVHLVAADVFLELGAYVTAEYTAGPKASWC